MTDEETNHEQPSQSEAAPTPATSERTFSQEEVNQIVAARLAKERTKSQPAPAPTRPKPAAESAANGNAEVAQMMAELKAMKTELAVGKNAGKHGFPAAMLPSLTVLFEKAAPEDPDAWFAEMAATFGVGKRESKPDTKQAPAVSSSDKGPPSAGPREIDALSNPNDMTEADIERLQDLHGKEKAGVLIRERVERWLGKASLTRPVPR